MTKGQISEGNKLIAEFMGYKYYPYEAPDNPSQQPKAKDYRPRGWIKGDPKYAYFSEKISGVQERGHHWLCRSHRDLRYYNEWNWIMPVVKAIHNLPFESKEYAIIYEWVDDIVIRNYDIQQIWHAVVEFIKWQNQRQPIRPGSSIILTH
jgi:hypothetical protein